MGRGKDDNDGDALWKAVTDDVTPLKKPVHKTSLSPAIPKPVSVRIKDRPSSSASPAPKGKEIDFRTRQKLERGKMAIEAVLDLHGHAKDSARAALVAFLLESWHKGRRCVLVITGKGRSGTGVLRASFADWIHEPPLTGVVLETSPARAKDGGDGAFYVLLRRLRP